MGVVNPEAKGRNLYPDLVERHSDVRLHEPRS